MFHHITYTNSTFQNFSTVFLLTKKVSEKRKERKSRKEFQRFQRVPYIEILLAIQFLTDKEND